MLYKKGLLRVLSAVTTAGKANYTESELILPALKFLSKAKRPVPTTDLIRHLQNIMKPTGHDAQIILGRKDSYFSQKVRNLKSHDSLAKLHLARYKKNRWWITDTGLRFLNTNVDAIQSMIDQGFKPKQISRDDEFDYSKLVIEEGTLTVREIKTRKRSDKLKAIAVTTFKKNHHGKVFCTVCSFSFLSVYGEHGRDFIEAHHAEPIHEKDMRGEKHFLRNILPKVALVCANCHRIIHRKKGQMLSIEDIKTMVGDHRCK